MRILLIGCDVGFGHAIAMALITREANRIIHAQPFPVEEVQRSVTGAPGGIIQAFSAVPSYCKTEDYYEPLSFNTRDRQTEREQARYHDARFPKWTHQKRRIHRSRMR